MQRFALCVLAATLLSGLAGCHVPLVLQPMPTGSAITAVRPVKAGFATISVDDLHAMPQTGRPMLLDVREPDEYTSGHVPGAVNVPLATVATWAGSHAKDTPLMVICHSGRRSAIASQTLADKGFTRITNIAGGTAAWIQKGYPVTTGSRR